MKHLRAVLLLSAVTACNRPDGATPAAPATASPVTGSAPGTPVQSISFADVSEGSGLSHEVVSGDAKKRQFIIETTGTGVAVLDFNHDGIDDLYFANGSDMPRFGSNANPTGWLYRGNADGSFSDVSAGSGAQVPMWGAGAFAADYDNDGNRDLYLTAFGRNTLLHANGDGTFTDTTDAAGVGDSRWSLGAAIADLDRDGLPDIYVANYLEFDVKHPPNDGKPCWDKAMEIFIFCGPMGLTGSADRFYRNLGDGTFADHTERAGLVDRDRAYGMSAAAFDADGDRMLDLYVANDSMANLFFRQKALGFFADRSLASGAAFNAAGKAQASMGIAVGDIDGDLDDDLFTTNFDHDVNTLHRNEGLGLFVDATDETGLGPPSYRMLGWSTMFNDLDNDGDLDVWVVNGHIHSEVRASELLGEYRQPLHVYANDGSGHFTLANEAIPGTWVGRGGSWLDVDRDGQQDLVLISLEGRPALFRNQSRDGGSWLELELEGTHCSRDAVGASVIATTATRRIRRAQVYTEGYLSSPPHRLHLGLGTATHVDLDIEWPCGTRARHTQVPLNRRLRAREGASALTPG